MQQKKHDLLEPLWIDHLLHSSTDQWTWGDTHFFPRWYTGF